MASPTRMPLRERAVAGEPAIVHAGDRTVVVLPFAVADPANLSLWRQMFFVRNYGFLALR